jgi:hypothetical protein
MRYAARRMPLLGPFGILFFGGIALCVIGGGLAYRMMKRHGGFDRAALAAVFADDSPMRRNPADRRAFRLGVFLFFFGVMTVFSGVSVGDARELRVCVDECHRQGYSTGKFGPSERDRNKASGETVRGCWCVGPAGSVEVAHPATRMFPPPAASSAP